MISPDKVAEVKFSRPPLGKRGYNEDEVDAFLDLIEADLRQNEDEWAEQIRYAEELERKLQEKPAPAPAPEPVQVAVPPQAPPVTPSAQAARILELAETTAAALTAESEAEAARKVRDAEAKAAQAISEARREADKLLDQARREAEELETRVRELRDFERNYRGRLEAYMESQLAAVRADAQIEPR